MANGDNVDDYIRQEMPKRHIPGMQIAVIRDGKPVKMGYYGLANVEHNVKVKPETLFQIQSMTKSFVATAIMMLVEEGKIGLDEKLSKYLDGTPATWNQVTIRHLLSHTSGIKDFINEPTASLRLDVTEEEVFRATVPRPLNFPTGDKYAYSNTNYHLLGMVIHKLTGKPWAQFVDERICKPLGMTHTKVYSQADIWRNRASGYLWRRGSLRNGEFIAPTILGYAGGGLSSTVEDLAKWDAALYGEQLLKRSSLEQMWTSATLNNGKSAGYGFGWGIGANNGHRVVSHGGSHVSGFQSHIARYLDDKLTVIVLTNLGSANPATLVQGIAHLYESGIRAASAMSPKPDPDKKRTARLRTFLKDVAGGIKESPLVVPGLAANLDDDDKAETAAVLNQMKAMEYLDEQDIRALDEIRNGLQVVNMLAYRISTRREPWFYRFWLADDGRLADFSNKE